MNVYIGRVWSKWSKFHLYSECLHRDKYITLAVGGKDYRKMIERGMICSTCLRKTYKKAFYK